MNDQNEKYLKLDKLKKENMIKYSFLYNDDGAIFSNSLLDTNFLL